MQNKVPDPAEQANSEETNITQSDAATTQTPSGTVDPTLSAPANALADVVTGGSRTQGARGPSTKRLLGKRWWQGVGAIVAAVGIVVMVIIAILSATYTQGPREVNTQSGGDCQVQGDKNELDCTVNGPR